MMNLQGESMAGADVLQGLSQEHQVCLCLLAALDQMGAAIGAGDERALRVARGIMARERGYGAHAHYAREELLFERMMARSPRGEAAVRGLSHEHDNQVRMGITLLEALDARLAGKPEDPARLRRLTAAYVEALRNHVGKEQQRVLPLAREILQEQDWALIETAFGEQRDPLAPPVSESLADVARWLSEHGEDPFARGQG